MPGLSLIITTVNVLKRFKLAGQGDGIVWKSKQADITDIYRNV